MTLSPNPFALARSLDRCAKWWWGASLALKGLGFGIGLLIFAPVPQEALPFVIAGCTILAEFTIVRSDALKGMAQLLRRKLDPWTHLAGKFLGPNILTCLSAVHSPLKNVQTATMRQKPISLAGCPWDRYEHFKM